VHHLAAEASAAGAAAGAEASAAGAAGAGATTAGAGAAGAAASSFLPQADKAAAAMMAAKTRDLFMVKFLERLKTIFFQLSKQPRRLSGLSQKFSRYSELSE
jgi:hypothetical protein